MLQDGQRIEYFVYVCTSNTVLIWQGIVFGYKALLQIIAIFLAFGTRKVMIEGLNDAKYIAGIIYVTSIVLAVLIVSFVTLEVYLNALAAVYSTGFTVLATLIMGFVFIPKVRNDFAGLHVCIFIICCVESMTYNACMFLPFLTPCYKDGGTLQRPRRRNYISRDWSISPYGAKSDWS